MTTEVQTQTLRERAGEALQQQQDKEAAQAEREYENEAVHLRKKIREVLAIDGAVALFRVERYARCVVEDLTFGVELNSSGNYTLTLIQECPHCHKQVTGWWVYSLETVGRALNGEINSWRHKEGECVKAKHPTPETTEHRLLQALRDFIAENDFQL